MFEGLPAETASARAAFADCLARSKAPAAPSDMLGAEFERCHDDLRRALLKARLERETIERVLHRAEALEAEIAAES